MATKHRPDAESVSMFADKLPGLRAFDSSDDQWNNAATGVSGLEVRSYRLLESLAIGRLPFRYELHHPQSDSDVPKVIQLATRRLLAGESSSKPLFVAIHSESSSCVGAIQALQRDSDERWSLQYLASGDAASSDNPVPILLLEYAIGEAGSCGARRIMARSHVDSPMTGALRATGFTAFAQEYVYALPVIPVGQVNAAVRAQQKSDVWGIHQLYLQTTPRDVQNAEALTSHEWDLDLEGRSRRGWLTSSENGPDAYVRVRTSRKYHCLDVMFRPEAHTTLPLLLNSVFAVLRHESPRPTYVLMRGYQQELDPVLTEAGFRMESEQLMMVRYTTAPVSARVVDGFELLEAVESNPRRVPSFYVRDMHE